MRKILQKRSAANRKLAAYYVLSPYGGSAQTAQNCSQDARGDDAGVGKGLGSAIDLEATSSVLEPILRG